MSNHDYPNQPGFGPGPFPMGQGGAMPPTVTQPKKRGRRTKGDRPSGKRSGTGWLFLVFAMAVGVLLILVTTSPGEKTYVIRAAKEIAPLTEITSAQFEIAAIDPAAVEPDALSAKNEKDARKLLETSIASKWFLYPVSSAQQIRPSMLAAAGSLETPLAADERLLSISARAAKAVAGSIRVGSLVDAYVSAQDGLTGVLGQKIEIVAVSLLPEQFDSVAKQQFDDPDKTLSDFVAEQPVGGTYVVRVKAADVAKYIAADNAGTLTLALHGENSAAFTESPMDLFEIICGKNGTSPVCQRNAE